MIIAADQSKYDAYWNAYRRIQGSGLRITTHPVVGPLLAVEPTVGFTFAGHRHVWLNAAQHVARLSAQTLAAAPVGVDLGVLTDGLGMLSAAVGVTLVPAPVPIGAPAPAAPPIIPGMNGS